MTASIIDYQHGIQASILTVVKEMPVANGADFSNVGMEVVLQTNVPNVQNRRQDAAHTLELLTQKSIENRKTKFLE